MADGDQNQNQQPPRYWFPYWSGPPPPVRPQLSRRQFPPTPPSSPGRPSPSRPRQPTPPHATSSRPSPSRASPLAPIREPPPPPNGDSNSNAGGTAAAPAPKPKPKDVDVVPQPEKTAVHPAAAETKHGKAAQHRAAHHHKEVEKEKKDEHKTKDKKSHAGEHKEKEKKHHADAGEDGKHGKEKDKEKEKHHHADAGEESKHKEKEAKAEHGKLHGEIKAGVADMVRRATGSGHGQGASVITLAGENKGASMKVGGKGKDGGSWKEHHRLDGGKPDGQRKQGMMTALINSNVQVINNSLLLQSSCSGGDPGVHLNLSAKSANKDKQKHAAADKSDKADAAKK